MHLGEGGGGGVAKVPTDPIANAQDKAAGKECCTHAAGEEVAAARCAEPAREGQEEVEGKAGEHDQDRLLMGVFPVPCGG